MAAFKYGDETEPNPTAHRKIILLTLYQGKLIAFHAINNVNFSVFFKNTSLCLFSDWRVGFWWTVFPHLGKQVPNLHSPDAECLGWLHLLPCSRHFGQEEAQGFFCLFVTFFLKNHPPEHRVQTAISEGEYTVRQVWKSNWNETISG